MIISRYMICFIFYSFLGWIYESIMCTLSEHEWQNRGFLFGPIIPIYGFGGVLGNIVFFDIPVDQLQHAPLWLIFVVGAVGSFIMEYITSYTLEKLFHARWWDYSHMPLNINGRVCLPFTLCFGAAAILIVKTIIPATMGVVTEFNPYVMEIIALLFMMMLGIDLGLTIAALNNMNKKLRVINDSINAQIAEAYSNLEESLTEKKVAFTEKKEQLEAGVFVKKELMLEQADELREKLSKEYIAQLVSSATPSQLGQLRHIKSFNSKDHNLKSLLEQGAKMAKDRLPKKH